MGRDVGTTARRSEIDAEPFVEAARAAVPALAADAARTEADRRVSDASLAAARAAGAFTLAAPRDAGGVEADLATRVRVLAELGRGCPSTAWIVATTAETKIALRAALTGQAHAVRRPGRGAVCLRAPGPRHRGARWPAGDGATPRAASTPRGRCWSPRCTTTRTGPRGPWWWSCRPSACRSIATGTCPGCAARGATAWSVTTSWSRTPTCSTCPAWRAGRRTSRWRWACSPRCSERREVRSTSSPRRSDSARRRARLRGLVEFPGAQQYFAEATHHFDSAEQRMWRIAETVDAVPPGERPGSRRVSRA